MTIKWVIKNKKAEEYVCGERGTSELIWGPYYTACHFSHPSEAWQLISLLDVNPTSICVKEVTVFSNENKTKGVDKSE